MSRLVSLLRSIRLRRLERNRVAILYLHDYWLRTLVLREIPATTIGVYPEALYFHPVVALRTAIRLLRSKPQTKGPGSPLKGWLRRVRDQYLLACLDATGADVVLTFIDNSGVFQRLSRIDASPREYFAIQNGTRTVYCMTDSPRVTSTPVISMTNLFCFGRRDEEFYRLYGHKIDRCIPSGSLVGGYYQSIHGNKIGHRRYDICFMSQWHAEFFNGDTRPFSKRIGASLVALTSLLRGFMERHAVRVAVCLRNETDLAEGKYFERELPGAERIASRLREFSSYRIADQSTLVMALNSTILAELFIAGTKVLWINPHSDPYFAMSEAGISYLEGADPLAFDQRVLLLLAMEEGHYREETADRARYINQFDPDCPPHEKIRAELLRALGATTNGPHV